MLSRKGEKTNPKPIYFIGAGPGDPKLLTIKARKLLDDADVIIYTGSLVPEKLLQGCKAKLFNSANMHLEQVMKILTDSYKHGLRTVRLHTGDPSLYSAIAEQIALLKKDSIPFKVVPGVTSGFAACASLGVELTIPEKVQTVIISRISGRTPVPEKESLEKLSKIQGSLILYLSINHIKEVTQRLSKGYPPNTPVAVVEKATWPEERIITGTLDDIVQKVEEAGIKKTAVIIVGEALKGITDPERYRSRLYHKEFSHGYRQGARHDNDDLLATFATGEPERKDAYIVYLGQSGKLIAETLQRKLQCHTQKISFKRLQAEKILAKKWQKIKWIIFIGACQIAIRTIAPHLQNKYVDPAVVTVDESAENVICILSGHIGGGNELAREIAHILDSRAVVTTQSDLLDLPALDLWARANRLVPANKDELKNTQALFRNKGRLKVFLQRFVSARQIPKGFILVNEQDEADVVIGPFVRDSKAGLHLVTRNVSLGTGCHRNFSPASLIEMAKDFLKEHCIHPFAIERICTIDKKAKEPAIKRLAEELYAELTTFSAEELNGVQGVNESEAVFKAVGARAVAEPAAVLCSNGGEVVVEKQKFQGYTFSIAIKRLELQPYVRES